MQRVQSRTDAGRAYRRAFEEFSLRARRVQQLTEHPDADRAALDRALVDLEKARIAYNGARDFLFECMLPTRHSSPPDDAEQSHRHHVKNIAELLWVGSGRPDGTEKDDWERAEEIVRGAVA